MKLLHTVLFILLAVSLLPQLLFSALSVMITDAGGSTWTALFLLGSWSMPVLTLTALGVSVSKRREGKVGKALLFFCLPLLSVLLIVLAVVGMSVFCDGRTTC